MNDRTFAVISIIALALIVFGAVALGVYFYMQTEGKCTANPVEFYNNNSELFGYEGQAVVFTPGSFYIGD